jgi:transcriptional regulator with XRE-family HTH domain
MINLRDEVYIKEFGVNLKKIRLSKGFSQEELAFSADVSLPQVTRIERGKVNPTLCTIKCLAIGLNIKTKDLFNFEDKFI